MARVTSVVFAMHMTRVCVWIVWVRGSFQVRCLGRLLTKVSEKLGSVWAGQSFRASYGSKESIV